MKYSASFLLSALFAVSATAQYGGGFENTNGDGNAPVSSPIGDGTGNAPVSSPVGDGTGNGVGTLPDTVQSPNPNGVADALPNAETSPVAGGGIGGAPVAQTQRGVVNCRNQICYSMAIPQSTSQSGTGNIFFQIYAPDTFSWVAMGTGSSMADSNMFIIYQDGQGNVTVSGRQASGRTMPTVPTQGAPLIELLDGSGVGNGIMMANFRCVNCHAWKQSQLDFTSTQESMVGAWRTGEPLNSDDINEQIGIHTGNIRQFTFDATQAQVVANANPFVGANAVPAEATADTNNNGGQTPGDSAGAGMADLTKRGLGVAVVLAALPLLAF